MAGVAIPEARVLVWLKRALQSARGLPRREGASQRRVSHIVVDEHDAYSAYREELEPVARLGLLEPTARAVGDPSRPARPDLLCIVHEADSDIVAAFEAKGETDHEKGIIQAKHYRRGAHESYLCIPTDPSYVLRQDASDVGVGILTVTAERLVIAVPAPDPRPHPQAVTAARGYLTGIIGERQLGSLGLNKPLHYAAAAVATALHPDPVAALRSRWLETPSTAKQCFRGATTLGLLSTQGALTSRGVAVAQMLITSGFELDAACRHTQRGVRLVDVRPDWAAALRLVLLEQPIVVLVVRALSELAAAPIAALELMQTTQRLDMGLSLAAIGAPTPAGDAWEMRPSTRFQLKAALLDVGILDGRLGRGASDGRGYDPSADIWQLGLAMRMVSPQPLTARGVRARSHRGHRSHPRDG